MTPFPQLLPPFCPHSWGSLLPSYHTDSIFAPPLKSLVPFHGPLSTFMMEPHTPSHTHILAHTHTHTHFHSHTYSLTLTYSHMHTYTLSCGFWTYVRKHVLFTCIWLVLLSVLPSCSQFPANVSDFSDLYSWMGFHCRTTFATSTHLSMAMAA